MVTKPRTSSGRLARTLPGSPRTKLLGLVVAALMVQFASAAAPARATDSTPPTAPDALMASNITAAGASFSWRSSTDGGRVIGYRIYRGPASAPDSGLTLIRTIDAVTKWTASALYSGTGYKFGVAAIDLANNESSMSIVSVTTAPTSDDVAPLAPASSSVSGTAFSSSRIDVVWGPSASADVAGYRVHRDGVEIGRVDLPGGLRYSDNGLAAATAHEYVIHAVDSGGNVSPGTAPRVVKTPPAGTIRIARGPYVTNATSNSAVVSWWTNLPTTGRVTYGVVTASEQAIDDSAGMVQHHSVSLTGLAAGASYTYTVASDAGAASVSAVGKFRTAPIPGQAFSFAGIADFGGGSPGATQNAANIANADTSFIQTFGDNIYPSAGLPDPDFSTKYSDFDARFFKPFAAALKSQVFFPANGDKEYFTDGAFWKTFPMLGDNHNWYSYNWGSAHVLVLDTEQSFLPGSAQYDFVQSDLANAPPSLWRIVVSHRPPYSSTTANSSSTAVKQHLVPLFEQYGVSLVLSGNSHNYERSIPLREGAPDSTGVTYIVSGGGGNGFNKFAIPQPAWSAFREDSVYEMVKVGVTPASLIVEAIRADTNEVLDTITLDRSSAETTAPTAPTSASIAGPTASSLNVTWAASADDVGVSGYAVYVGDAYVGATTVTSFVLHGVPCGTTRSIGIVAIDAAGNESPITGLNGTTAACAPSATWTFSADADAQVREASPALNYGNSPSLSSGGGAGPSTESYLRFTVGGIAADHVVRSATLRVYVPTNGTIDGPGVFSVADTTWAEREVSWSTRPARAVHATDDIGAVPSGTWMEFDVTPLVLGNGTISFCIGRTPTGDATDYGSRESKTMETRPQLVVVTASG